MIDIHEFKEEATNYCSSYRSVTRYGPQSAVGAYDQMFHAENPRPYFNTSNILSPINKLNVDSWTCHNDPLDLAKVKLLLAAIRQLFQLNHSVFERRVLWNAVAGIRKHGLSANHESLNANGTGPRLSISRDGSRRTENAWTTFDNPFPLNFAHFGSTFVHLHQGCDPRIFQTESNVNRFISISRFTLPRLVPWAGTVLGTWFIKISPLALESRELQKLQYFHSFLKFSIFRWDEPGETNNKFVTCR